MPPKIHDDRILHAVVATVIARGYAGATTREIATAAGVNEATLFRRFGDKQHLVLAAVRAEVARFDEAGIAATGDLHADLVRIVGLHQRAMSDGRLQLTLIAELHRSPELAVILREPLVLRSRLQEVIAHYQGTGELAGDRPTDVVHALLGPLIMRSVANQVESDLDPPPDPEDVVARFLDGHRAAR